MSLLKSPITSHCSLRRFPCYDGLQELLESVVRRPNYTFHLWRCCSVRANDLLRLPKWSVYYLLPRWKQLIMVEVSARSVHAICCWVNHLAPANCVAGSYRRACVSATVAYCLVFNELECMHFYRRAACSTVAVSKRDYVATNNLMLTNNAAIIEKIPFALCRRKEYDYTS